MTFWGWQLGDSRGLLWGAMAGGLWPAVATARLSSPPHFIEDGQDPPWWVHGSCLNALHPVSTRTLAGPSPAPPPAGQHLQEQDLAGLRAFLPSWGMGKHVVRAAFYESSCNS